MISEDLAFVIIMKKILVVVVVIIGDHNNDLARARSARARRACALRALGLLLADGVLTVGWGKTFWRVGQVPTRKRP